MELKSFFLFRSELRMLCDVPDIPRLLSCGCGPMFPIYHLCGYIWEPRAHIPLPASAAKAAAAGQEARGRRKATSPSTAPGKRISQRRDFGTPKVGPRADTASSAAVAAAAAAISLIPHPPPWPRNSPRPRRTRKMISTALSVRRCSKRL